MPPLYGRRVAQQERARQEAAGRVLWTPGFSATARLRLWAVVEGMIRHESWDKGRIWGYMNGMFESQLGVSLPYRPSMSHFDNLREYFVKTAHEDEELPSAFEALLYSLYRKNEDNSTVDAIQNLLNMILREERISFELVNMQMVPFESRELHDSVIVPALTLLSGRPGWVGVEAAYKKALHEIGGDPADAITDAGTALQEALTVLGCEGNALGPLLRSAKAKGLLAPHDAALSSAIEKLISWVSADRSTMGDAHNTNPADPSDAWLAVHVVGALILRLADGPVRAAT